MFRPYGGKTKKRNFPCTTEGFDTPEKLANGMAYLLFAGDCWAVAEAQPGVLGQKGEESIDVHGVHSPKDFPDQIGCFHVNGFFWFRCVATLRQRKGPAPWLTICLG